MKYDQPPSCKHWLKVILENEEVAFQGGLAGFSLRVLCSLGQRRHLWLLVHTAVDNVLFVPVESASTLY